MTRRHGARGLGFGHQRASESDTARSPRAVPLWLILCAVALGSALRAPIAGQQRALEGALVLAREVAYPPDSLMAHYYLGTWTVLHQAGALLLLAGVDQRVVEHMFGILPAGLTLGAFTMTIYGFCGRPFFSLAAGTICLLTGLLAQRFASPDYPLLGITWDAVAEHTFGVWSGALAAWFFGALAGGRNVMAGVTAALLVAVHPVVGTYVVGLTIAVLLARRLLLPNLPTRGIARGLALGGLASAVSFAFYLAARPPMTAPVDAAALETYMRVWDGHRKLGMPPRVWAVVLMPVSILGVALLAILLRSRDARTHMHVAIVALLAAFVASTALYFCIHLAPGLVPALVERAMPARLLNVHAHVAGAVTVGIAAWLVEQSLPRLGSAGRSRFLRALWRPAAVYSVFVLILGGAVDAGRALGDVAGRNRDLATHGLPVLSASEPFWWVVRRAGIRGQVLTSFEARQPALVGGHLAVAFDPTGFDFVPYLPHTARDVQRFVEKGYGVSFSNPPQELRFSAALEGDPQRAYWESLTRQQWSELREELGVAAVVAPTRWRIRLRPRAVSPVFSVYPIPRSRAP